MVLFNIQFAVVLCLTVNSVISQNVANDVCAINIQSSLNKTSTGNVKEPLFLKPIGGGFELMIPNENGILPFKSGESALIACTSDGKPSLLTFSKCFTIFVILISFAFYKFPQITKQMRPFHANLALHS